MSRRSGTIVVGYSKQHFSADGKKVPFANSSAGLLAKAIYEAATQVSEEVHYLDAISPSEWPEIKEVDVLISIESCFVDLQRKYWPKNSLLFAVNQESDTGMRKLTRPIDSGFLPLKAILGGYDLRSRDPRAAEAADQILMVGDNLTLGTYLRKRNLKDLYAVSYGYASQESLGQSENLRNLILIPASSIGLRKGSDFIERLCIDMEKDPANRFRVGIIGSASSSYWASYVTRLESEYPRVIENFDWVNSDTSIYEEVEARTLCCVFPSREEGLVGAAVESLQQGIPTFATIDCGLGPRPEYFSLLPGDEDYWATKILKFCLDPTLVDESQADHLRFQSTEQVAGAVKRFILSGDLYPNFYLQDSGPKLSVFREHFPGSSSMKDWLGKSEFGDHGQEYHSIDKLLLALAELATNPVVDSVEVFEAGESDDVAAAQLVASELSLLGSTYPYEVLNVLTRRESGSTAMQIAWHQIGPPANLPMNFTRIYTGFLRFYSFVLAWRLKPLRTWARFLRQRLQHVHQ